MTPINYMLERMNVVKCRQKMASRCNVSNVTSVDGRTK